MGMSDTTYYREHEAEDAMSVLAKWMGKNSKLQVVYHNGTAVDADIFKGIIRIPRLACASGITQEALMLLRSSVYHEAGHIDDTKLDKSEYPKGALFEIWNSLEDRRMEAVLAGKHKGCELVFRWATHHYNKKIAEKITAGGIDAPLWESLVAMGFMVEGVRPAWMLTAKAQDYYEAAYNDFSQVSLCKNAKDCVELAKKIYKTLKQVNDEWKKEQPPQQGQQGEHQQDQQGEGKEQKQDKPQQGGGKDFDDYENEKPGKGQGDDSDSDDQDGEESSEGKEKKSKKSDGKGKEEKAKKGNKSEDQDDADGSEKGKKAGEEGDEGKDGEGDETGSEGDQDGKDGDQDNKGEGKGDKEGKKGDSQDDEEGSENGEGAGDGDEGSDGDEAESDGNADGNGAGKGNGQDEGDQGQQSKDHADGQGKPGDTPYNPKNDAPKGGKGDGNDKRDLEDEMDGMSKQQAQNEDLEEFFKNLPAEDKQYVSRRDLDVHTVPATTDEDKTSYRERLSQVSVTVATMTRTLEQALRSMSKCHKNPFLRYGDVDFDRLVDIAKGLSKEVFYDTRDGMKLDVAVSITIDESGSMSNYYDVQLLAMAIGEALNAMHIPFEIIGSTTAYGGGDRRMVYMEGFSRVNPIVYKSYKLFSEGWASVRQRIVHTGAYHHNVDGEVVEYAAFRLLQRRERRKVIFSLSDGEPCAGHGNDAAMGVNLKRVCNRVRKQGVEVYGFGIKTSSPRAFYGKNFFVQLDDVKKMGADFVREFSKIITAGKVRV